MSTSQSKPPRRAPAEDMLRIVDPLGEIQRTAQSLHKEAGSPAGVDWRDYWGVAEDLLTAGRSAGEASDRQRQSSVTAPTTSLELSELAAQRNDVPLSLIAAALQITLDEHESLCLGRILSETAIVAADDNATHGPFTTDQIASMLAHLAHEYESSFLQLNGAAGFSEVTLPKRRIYWLRKIETQRMNDEPLTHADQNTMQRLTALLRKCERVSDLRQGSLQSGTV